MTTGSFQRPIRFTENKWNAVAAAAERAGMVPGSCIRGTAGRVAGGDLHLYGGGFAPELAQLIKRTFRGARLPGWLKRVELAGKGKGNAIDRAAAAALSAQDGKTEGD